ncbi:MAG: FAD:protein FMN transferase [Pseudomonadota bacterium]|nr:FAD:protein FMN transferase [Pseudomonadota bacterium]
MFTFAACTKEPIYRQQSYVFGTLVEVTLWGENDARAQELIGKVLREFDRLHKELHAWQPSELTKVNEAIAKGEAITTTPELAAILQDATKLSVQSNGTFNPAIGKLIELWGFQSDEFKPVIPDPEKIKALVHAKPSMADLKIDGATISSGNRDVQIDLGGYAKGYALDRAIDILKKEGTQNALINIGGNIIALGERGNRPWRIGIQHPRKPSAIAVMDIYNGEAIGTSGDYQRYFEKAGQRYCHIIDPATGRPVANVQSVTIVAKRGIQAGVLSDVASKPIFVAASDKWREAARAMGIDLVMRVDGNGGVDVTSLMSKRLTFDDKKLTVREVP